MVKINIDFSNSEIHVGKMMDIHDNQNVKVYECNKHKSEQL